MSWYDPAWNSRFKFTIKGEENQFTGSLPLQVPFSLAASGFWDAVNPSGADLVVADASGNKFDRELVFIDVSGQDAEMYFGPAPVVSGFDTDFYVYYDNISGMETNNSAAVWPSGQYVAVYHMEPAGVNGIEIPDSSWYQHTGYTYNNGVFTLSTTNTITEDGYRGSAIYLTDNKDTCVPPPAGDTLNLTENLTIELWHYAPDHSALRSGSIGETLLAKYWSGGGGYLVRIRPSYKDISYWTGNAAGYIYMSYLFDDWNEDGWNHIVWTRNGYNIKGFINGVLLYDVTSANFGSRQGDPEPTPRYLGLGRNSGFQYFSPDGAKLDEVRLKKVASTPEEVILNYNIQASERVYTGLIPLDTTAWESNFKITAQGAEIAYTGPMPLYYPLEYAPVSGFWDSVDPSGRDLIVVDASGYKLERELVFLDTENRRGEMYFGPVDVTAGQNQDFYIHTGNPNANETNSTKVWPFDKYGLVLHMNSVDPSGLVFANSTVWGNDCTRTSHVAEDGKLGTAQARNTAGEGRADIPTAVGVYRAYFEPYTIDLWIKGDVAQAGLSPILEKGAWGAGYEYAIWLNHGNIVYHSSSGAVHSYGFVPSTNSWNYGGWNKITATYKLEDRGRMYSNGVLRASNPTEGYGTAGYSSSNSSLVLFQDVVNSASIFYGAIDEVRFRRAHTEPTQVLTEYNNEGWAPVFWGYATRDDILSNSIWHGTLG
jgi:hypothetical protein